MWLIFSDADECQGRPCINAYSCQNLVGDYRCKCQKGWAGKNCDHNINDCVGQCQHGATCIDLVNDYHCACQPGYTGKYYNSYRTTLTFFTVNFNIIQLVYYMILSFHRQHCA